MSNLLLSLWVTLAATQPSTGQLTITVRGIGVEPSSPSQAHVRATAVAGQIVPGGAPVETALQVPGRATLSLARSAAWKLELLSDAWWASSTTVFIDKDDQHAELRAWPTAVLAGRVKTQGREEPPAALVITFQAPAQIKQEAPRTIRIDSNTEPQGSVDCPVKEGLFACRVPGTVLDLKLRARGFVSHYRWAQRLTPGEKLDVGTLTLVAGASVVGRVSTAEGSVDPETCVVKLVPLSAALPDQAAELAKWSKKTLEGRVDAHGFFTFEGIGPGNYDLQASQPGFATTSSGRFTVMERSETQLRDTIILNRPLTLNVTVSPALDASNQPWGLHIAREGTIPNRFETVRELRLREDGTVAVDDLTPGRLRLTVYDSSNSRFLVEDVELTPTSGEVSLKVDLVELSGKVMLGRRPLPSSVWFGRMTGKASIKMEADNEGEFVGSLPRDGEWEVQVTSDDPPVNQVIRGIQIRADKETRRAKVEIRLPDGRLRGVVVDDQGTAVAGAFLTLGQMPLTFPASGKSADNGRFEFAGLNAGIYTVSAEDMAADGPRESGAQVVAVAEDGQGPDVRLVLSRKRKVEGVVVGGGQGVPGAKVAVHPSATDRCGSGFAEETTTDSMGVFSVTVAMGCRAVTAVVMPPGRALKAFALVLDQPRKLTLEVPPAGGDIQLAFSQPVDLRDPAKPKWLVWQDGVVLGPVFLANWAQIMGVPRSTSPLQENLKDLAPGFYKACWFKNEDEAIQATLVGTGAGSTCAEGYLPPNGTLSLKL